MSQAITLHELIWSLVSSLAPQHPLADLKMAGHSLGPLSDALHSTLSAVADLLPLLPPGSPLQTVAIRCFSLHFPASDHSFLHRSHLFSYISSILASLEENNVINVETNSPVIQLQDLTPSLEMKVSSRSGMIASLADNSTETFWESGEEDRNKTKHITLTSVGPLRQAIIYVHVDNVRDMGAKVTQVTFKSGEVSALDSLEKLKCVDLDQRFAGWTRCSLGENVHQVRIELKGPDNTLRVRQVKVVGEVEGLQGVKGQGRREIERASCEAETLRVFRALTSQVFGKLMENQGEEASAGDEIVDNEGSELREHMVSVLFSRSAHLSQLQKQVSIICY